jgi:zinc protease
MSAQGMISRRPVPGEPRPYDFPDTVRTTLANGMRVIVTPMPGRELVAASLALRAGAADEPDEVGGATVLAARRSADVSASTVAASPPAGRRYGLDGA